MTAIQKITPTNNGLEFRHAVFEMRDDDNEFITFKGKATSFRETITIGSWFQERIDRGAFSDWISDRTNNVFLKIMHEGLPIASRESDTMSVVEEADGIYVQASLDKKDPDVVSIRAKLSRGIIRKMSVGMVVKRQQWEEEDDPEKLPLRIIEEAELREVSIVDMPAYSDTNAELAKRALNEFRKSEIDLIKDKWLREQRAKLSTVLEANR